MNFHEVASIFPLMEGKDFDELCQDIAANGLHEPIWTHDGLIIDGRNRYRACELVGVNPEYREYSGDNLLSFVISLNLKRRHLNESQRAAIAAKLANMRQGERTDMEPSANLQKVSQSDAAELMSVSPRLVASAKAVEQAAPELMQQVEAGKMSLHEAEKKVKQKKREAVRAQMVEQAATATLPEMCQIFTGDFREVSKSIPDNSIDIIFTDPPYDDETIPLYGDMAIMAARILKPGGSLITYVGHHAMPNIFPLMTPHLRFWWTLCLNYAEGPYNRLVGKNIFVQWKPLLWFVKERRGNSEFVADRIDAPAPNKIEHDWQQGEVDYYISKLCEPGGVVLDPFMGSGTTLVAALKVGMYGIGIELDASTAAIAKQRISNEFVS